MLDLISWLYNFVQQNKIIIVLCDFIAHHTHGNYYDLQKKFPLFCRLTWQRQILNDGTWFFLNVFSVCFLKIVRRGCFQKCVKQKKPHSSGIHHVGAFEFAFLTQYEVEFVIRFRNSVANYVWNDARGRGLKNTTPSLFREVELSQKLFCLTNHILILEIVRNATCERLILRNFIFRFDCSNVFLSKSVLSPSFCRVPVWSPIVASN